MIIMPLIIKISYEMALHKIIHLRSDQVSVGKNGYMFAALNCQKLSISHSFLKHFGMNFKFHQLVLSPMNNQNGYV